MKRRNCTYTACLGGNVKCRLTGFVEACRIIKLVQVTRFDGSNSTKRKVNGGLADIEFAGRVFVTIESSSGRWKTNMT